MDKRRAEVVRSYSFQELEPITIDFSVERKLSEGAFGAVFRGVLRGGKETIAVKRLINEAARLPAGQFESEVTTLRRIQHKNIARLEGCNYVIREVTASGDTGHEAACHVVTERLLCYELPKGPDLDTILFGIDICSSKQGLHWEMRFKIILGICQGVQYLHKDCPNAPIVGLDLNPATVWLDDNIDMVPKLGVFGHSKILLEKAASTLTMNVVGSTGHMAPEYIKSGIITSESDIFSLGVLIVEIVTGKKCNSTYHSGRSFVEDVQMTWTKDILSQHPSPEERSVLKSLIKMGLRCVEEKPEHRPTIDQIIHSLQYKFTKTKVDKTAWTDCSYSPPKWPAVLEGGAILVESKNCIDTATPCVGDDEDLHRHLTGSQLIGMVRTGSIDDLQLVVPDSSGNLLVETGEKRPATVRRTSHERLNFGFGTTPRRNSMPYSRRSSRSRSRSLQADRGTKRSHSNLNGGGGGIEPAEMGAKRRRSPRKHEATRHRIGGKYRGDDEPGRYDSDSDSDSDSSNSGSDSDSREIPAKQMRVGQQISGDEPTTSRYR